MKTILHISADFPDPLAPGKTKAVESLIGAAHGFRHIVYSLNRVNWRSDIAMLDFAEDRVAIAYGAPPYGLRLLQNLAPVADAIGADLARRGVAPDLIHAHKFSIEGVIADTLASRTGAPFIASIWGDTDSKYLDAKPGLRAHYRAIAARAALLLPPAPWSLHHFAAALGVEASRFALLPVMTAADAILPPRPCGQPKLVTLFAWDSWRRKGFDTLAEAMALLSCELPDITLDVFGRGGAKAFLEMSATLARFGVTDRVKLQGALPHAEVQAVLNGYAGFALPSRRETYGMVFAEALLAGLPILWPQNQGVDGFFEDMAVGYAARACAAEDVAHGMRVLVTQEARLKHEIGRLQTDGAFGFLRRGEIGARYRQILEKATIAPPQAAASVAVGLGR